MRGAEFGQFVAMTSRDRTTQPAARRKSRRARLLLAAASTCVVLALAEAGARLATRPVGNGLSRIGPVLLLPLERPEAEANEEPVPSDPAPYVASDAELGWCSQPNARTDLGTTNAQAVRGGPAEGYSATVPAGKVRALTFGDSFVHCDEVADADTWQAQLQSIRPDVEAVNFGVPGYGTDQAFLRWRRESLHLQSTVSLLCIWPEDICRNLNLDRFYMVPQGMSAAKPRFVLRDGALELVGQPCVARGGVPSRSDALLQEHEAWMLPGETEWHALYHVRLLRLASSALAMVERRSRRAAIYSGADPRGNDVTLAICRQFAAEARARDTRPVVVLIPMRDLLAEYPGGAKPLPIVRMLQDAGIETWDLSPKFAHVPDLDRLNPPKRHMTAAGNRVIAEALAELLPKP